MIVTAKETPKQNGTWKLSGSGGDPFQRNAIKSVIRKIGTWGRSCSTQDPKNGTRGGIVLHHRYTHSRRFFLSGLCPSVGSTQGRIASLIPKMQMRATIGAHLFHQQWGWQRLLYGVAIPLPIRCASPVETGRECGHWVRIGETERLTRVRSVDTDIVWRDGDGVAQKKGTLGRVAGGPW